MFDARLVLSAVVTCIALLSPDAGYSSAIQELTQYEPEADTGGPARTRFARIATDERGRETALQVSIVTYVPAKDTEGVSVDLVSAVHVADRSYYAELVRRFRGYDAVLYELIVSEPADKPSRDNGARSLVSTTQVAMKTALGLSFQLDQIDYTSDNFVHADLTAAQLRQSMTDRDESLYVYFWRLFYTAVGDIREDPYGIRDLKLMTRLLATGHPNVPKVMLAHEIARMDRPQAILDAGSGSAIIDSRNQRAIDVMKEQVDSGARRIGIFYGLAHMPDLEARLKTQLGMVRERIEWVAAWDLSPEPPDPGN